MPTGITVVKRFTYRGKPEEFSNTYWLTGGTTPAGNAAWLTLATAVATSELKCYPASVEVVRYYGYAEAGAKSAFQYDFDALAQTTLKGNASTGSNVQPLAGDQAVMIRALCGQASTGRNKYLRKYFHGGYAVQGTADQVDPNFVVSLGTHATKMTDGSLAGGWKWCSESGAVGTFPLVNRFTTTRTLKRRGRRPS